MFYCLSAIHKAKTQVWHPLYNKHLKYQSILILGDGDAKCREENENSAPNYRCYFNGVFFSS